MVLNRAQTHQIRSRPTAGVHVLEILRSVDLHTIVLEVTLDVVQVRQDRTELGITLGTKHGHERIANVRHNFRNITAKAIFNRSKKLGLTGSNHANRHVGSNLFGKGSAVGIRITRFYTTASSSRVTIC